MGKGPPLCACLAMRGCLFWTFYVNAVHESVVSHRGGGQMLEIFHWGSPKILAASGVLLKQSMLWFLIIFKCFVLDLFALGCAWHQEKKKDGNAATKSNCSLNAAVFATPNVLYSFLSSSFNGFLCCTGKAWEVHLFINYSGFSFTFWWHLYLKKNSFFTCCDTSVGLCTL